MIGDVQCYIQAAASSQGAELEALRAQMARLQAEKNDLVAMNSELQLKVEQGSGDDDFIEVIRVSVSCRTHIIIQEHIYLNYTRGLFQTGP